LLERICGNNYDGTYLLVEWVMETAVIFINANRVDSKKEMFYI